MFLVPLLTPFTPLWAMHSQADTALSEVVGLVPSYLDDMRLLEAMDALVEGARRKAAGELDRNKVGQPWVGYRSTST